MPTTSRQVRLLRSLGVNVRTGNLGTPGTAPEPGASLVLWERAGVSPTLQQLTLDIHGGGASVPRARICVETEFVFDRTGGSIGPHRMRLVHRAASGGLVKLTRYICTKADDSSAFSYGSVDSLAGPHLSLLPVELCALGNTEQHARTVQYLLLHHFAHDRMSREPAAVFAEVFEP